MDFKYKVQMAIEDFKEFQDDEDISLAFGNVTFLSTKPNSHLHKYTEKVIREYAHTYLGKFLVAEYDNLTQDVTTHTSNQLIVGYIPKNQEVKYETDKDGYFNASVDVIVSKIYAKNVYDLFKSSNYRAVSVEQLNGYTPETENNKDGIEEKIVVGFEGIGITILGLSYNGSVPNANIKLTQMSKDNIGDIEMKYVKYAEKEKKTYKVDKSKESMSEKAWGDVDKISLRNKVMDAKNRDSLIKDVYALVEDGWEDAPSEHLKYPIMELKDDTFVYNRYGLSSALAYAKQENETSVVSKVEKIYKKMDLDKEEKMSEILNKLEKLEKRLDMNKNIEKYAVEIGDVLWSRVYNLLEKLYPRVEKDGSSYCSIYYLRGIYEENSQKFIVIQERDSEESKLYRLDMVYTEDEFSLSKDFVEVEQVFIETNKMQLFKNEDIEKYETKIKEDTMATVKEKEKPVEDNKPKEEKEQMATKTEKMEKDIDDDDNDDMDEVKTKMADLEKKVEEYQKEIVQLQEFKEKTLSSEKESIVSNTLSRIKEFVDSNTYEQISKSGESCKYEDITGWKNEALAMIADKALDKISQLSSREDGILDMGKPVETVNTNKSIYDKYR